MINTDSFGSYQNCDTTTQQQNCLNTPFSVKDILNMPHENEYIDNTVPYILPKDEFSYDEEYSTPSQHWENNGYYHQQIGGYDYAYNYHTEQMHHINNNCVKMEASYNYPMTTMPQVSYTEKIRNEDESLKIESECSSKYENI